MPTSRVADLLDELSAHAACLEGMVGVGDPVSGRAAGAAAEDLAPAPPVQGRPTMTARFYAETAHPLWNLVRAGAHRGGDGRGHAAR